LKTLAAAAALPKVTRAGVVKLRLIVLDVGGTILEDRGDVVATLRTALGHRDIGVTAAEIAPWRGASKRSVIQHFVDQQSKKSATDRQTLGREIYKDFNSRLSRVYETVLPIPGAEDAIRKMLDDGYLVATTTGFDREIVMPIFQRLSWKKYFTAIVASDDVAQGRPSPYMIFHAMEAARVDSVTVVMAVGDTPLDLQAAGNAGVIGVGVLSGAGTVEQLRREPHTDILPSVDGLPALLNSKR